MKTIVLHGRKVSGGAAEGEALVTRGSLGGYGTFDLTTGDIVDVDHEWLGQNVKGKVLVFRTAQGSSGRGLQHGVFHRGRAQPHWQGKLTPRDYAALTPLIWEHVNPYGRFELDMTTRLDLQ